jgi:hypothetical protein
LILAIAPSSDFGSTPGSTHDSTPMRPLVVELYIDLYLNSRCSWRSLGYSRWSVQRPYSVLKLILDAFYTSLLPFPLLGLPPVPPGEKVPGPAPPPLLLLLCRNLVVTGHYHDSGPCRGSSGEQERRVAQALRGRVENCRIRVGELELSCDCRCIQAGVAAYSLALPR